MSMFRTIYAFELRYWVKQPMVYVLMVINALLVFGAVASDNVTIGQSFDNLLKNAPYVVESLYAYMSAVTYLMATAFVQAGALRDFNYRTEEIIFTTPLQKTPYLMGRFFAACTISLIPYLGVTLGILAAGLAPWVDPVRLGPVAWGAHLMGFLAFAVPNTLMVGGIVFAIAAVTRRTAATFVGAIGILVAYSIAGTLLGDLDNERVAVLVDAFGIGTFANLTKYWTVSERNTRYLPLTGTLLLNRALWVALAMAAAAGGLRAFRFTLEETGWRRSKKARPAPETEPEPVLHLHATLPSPKLSFTTATHVRQALSQARVDFWGILKSVPFGVIMFIGVTNAGFALWQANTFYGLTAWPITYRMVDLIRGTMYLFTIIVMVLYTGELVWKERTARLDEVHDALPHPIWATAVGKLLAMIGLTAAIQVAAMLMGMVAQLAHGYTNLEPGVWIKEMLVLDLVGFTFLAILSFLVHALVNNKFLGYFVFVTAVIVNTFIWIPLKTQAVMLRYGETPAYTYSDMNGYGPYVSGLAWFNAYWLAFAGMLVMATIVFWLRGLDTPWAVRWRNARLRFRGSTRGAFAAFLVAWLSLGGWVFYNTQVVNAYTPTRTAQDRQVAYETNYKATYEGMLQPRVVDVRYEIDVFPRERDLRTRGTAILVNKGAVPIDTLFVNLQDELDMSVEFTNATVVREDEDLSVRFYHVSPALAPGDTMTASFTADYVTEGFENQVRATQIAPNGTFFNNGFIMPTLGYQSGREMADRNERRKRDLPERDRMPSLQRNCTDACMNTYITNMADWVTMETVISTSPDQIAVAPGSLVREWTEDGRRYFRYVLDHRSLAFGSFISADYEVKREKWGDVDVEVYYDAKHPYNVDKMANSVRKSLAYNEENFGPYRHKQARIIEFPRYAAFAQAFPGTMPYSESIGFIARIEDEDDIDMVFYVTAHEMAHQWWAHQVVGAEMEGATVLSETLAQYSAIMTMEREYGLDQVFKFLKYEMDNYLRSRGAEAQKEKPLMRVDASQGYIHYRKGSVALYYLKEMIGEDRVNAALRDVVETFGYAEPPYPTSHDLVDRLRAQTPDSLQYLITDLFEEITLFDNRVIETPTVETLDDGRYRVSFQVQTGKIRADSLGVETPIPMNDYVDVAVLAEPEKGKERGRVLATERRRLTDGQHTIEFVVEEQPWQVGVDPGFLLIDRITDDNLKRVRGG
jgi:ABC-type transport system involved in multi-copper enzyme maturation permease subunit